VKERRPLAGDRLQYTSYPARFHLRLGRAMTDKQSTRRLRVPGGQANLATV
jgi:hypothetical protein